MSELTYRNKPKEFKIHPKMFLLYLSMASMVMLFSAFSSALIVKRGDTKHWLDVHIPIEFLFSTIAIVLSSLTIYLAYKNIGTKKFRVFSLITIVLACFFVFLQVKGWNTLSANGTPYVGNPSGTFVYFISGIHGVHYVFGIFFLILLDRLYSGREKVLEYSIYYNILQQFWHFIGLIWVYLYLFFKFIIYN